MKSLRVSRGVFALVAVLLPSISVPCSAANLPFELNLFPESLTLGPGEVSAVPLFITRDLSNCSACQEPSPADPPISSCCTGAITISAEGFPPGVIGCLSDGGLCLPSVVSDQPDLVLDAGFDIVPGTYELLVQGTAQDGPRPRSQSATVSLTLVPFSFVVARQVELLAGAGVVLPLSVARMQGFDDPVDFSFHSEHDGLTGEIALDPETGDPVSLSLASSASLADGIYDVTLEAVSGGLSRSIRIQVFIRAAFRLSVSPGSSDTVPGKTVTFGIGVQRDSQFVAPIAFTFTTGHPGISGNLVSAGTDKKNLVLTVQPNVPPGSYLIGIAASGAGIAKSTAVVLKVHRFLVQLGDTSALLFPGDGQVSIPVTLVRGTGFTDGVSFSLTGLPTGTGIGRSFVPASTTGSTSSLRLSASRLAPAGEYVATVRATSGSTVESAVIGIEVLPGLLP